MEPLVSVSQKPIYSFDVEKVVYGQGLRRTDWHSKEGEVINLTLDAYIPGTPFGGLRPAILLFHGGGFKGGSSEFENMVRIAEFYAKRGWAVFSVNYRLKQHHGNFPSEWGLHFKAVYPAGRDAKAAVRWLHANATRYQVSTNHITVMGGSTGGMLALMLGISDPGDYRDEISTAEDPTLETTHLNASSDVQAVVAFWSGDQLLEPLKMIDHKERVDRSDPPTLLIHGNKDHIVPVEKSKHLLEKLTKVGVTADLHILQGRKHAAWNAKVKDGRNIYGTAFDFIVDILNLPQVD